MDLGGFGFSCEIYGCRILLGFMRIYSNFARLPIGFLLSHAKILVGPRQVLVSCLVIVADCMSKDVIARRSITNAIIKHSKN